MNAVRMVLVMSAALLEPDKANPITTAATSRLRRPFICHPGEGRDPIYASCSVVGTKLGRPAPATAHFCCGPNASCSLPRRGASPLDIDVVVHPRVRIEGVVLVAAHPGVHDDVLDAIGVQHPGSIGEHE